MSKTTSLISGETPRWPFNYSTKSQRACGRELPPVTIYCAPTIAALAAVLEQPADLRFPPLVLLKDGSAEPPLFITHGLGGSVIDFFQVVKHIRTPHPIQGMQAKGIDGTEEPFDRIEDMAQFYLDAIRQVQPHGPYLLAGYSLGGLVTLEMAQRLTAVGEKVALLAMLDSYPDIRYLSLAQRTRLLTRLATRRATTAMKLPVGEASFSYHPPLAAPLARAESVLSTAGQCIAIAGHATCPGVRLFGVDPLSSPGFMPARSSS